MTVEGAPTYGQDSPIGNCAVWRLRFLNNSDTEIVQIVFAPPSGEYTNFLDFDHATQTYPPAIAADSPPAVLDVSLPPHDAQVLRFKICTSTPPPEAPHYQYSTLAPRTVRYRWATGQEATTCFALGC